MSILQVLTLLDTVHLSKTNILNKQAIKKFAKYTVLTSHQTTDAIAQAVSKTRSPDLRRMTKHLFDYCCYSEFEICRTVY